MNNTQQSSNSKKQKNYVHTREQKGHSIIKHILLCLVGVGFFTIPYYTISPNHYWHT
ncbi:hypothetical protein SEML1_0607 [Candidatus Southlakia epibionticum]|uniref:Uncharacterized protein n=1 Tax=Candidatus Southlakia epibionticum TaxID=3043284 RepID=A0ABY8WWM0_9BACT|nr:hypothetical protein SEML1_0607 [Candidatus Saccharimonadaceae bacterium ML1]